MCAAMRNPSPPPPLALVLLSACTLDFGAAFSLAAVARGLPTARPQAVVRVVRPWRGVVSAATAAGVPQLVVDQRRSAICPIMQMNSQRGGNYATAVGRFPTANKSGSDADTTEGLQKRNGRKEARRQAPKGRGRSERGAGKQPLESPRGQASGSLRRVIDQLCKLEGTIDGSAIDRVLEGHELESRKYTTVFKALGKAGKWEVAVTLGEWLYSQPADAATGELSPNLSHYKALVGACAAAGRLSVARQLIAQMRRRGLVPSAHIYVSLINGVSQASAASGDVAMLRQTVLALVDESEAAAASDEAQTSAEPISSSYVYEAALRALFKHNDADAAIRLMQRMRAQQLPRDEHCYATVLQGLRATGAWREAMAELQELKAEPSISVNGVHYSLVIGTCVRGGVWQQALQMFDERRESIPEPVDSFCYSGAIAACRRGREWQRAITLFDEFRTSASPQEPSLPFMLENAVAACHAAKQYSESAKLLERCVGADQGGAGVVQPTDQCVVIVLDACRQLGDADSATRIYEAIFPSAQDRGRAPGRSRQPTAFILNNLLGALVASGRCEEALRQFDAHDETYRNAKTLELAVEAADKACPQRSAELFAQLKAAS